MKGLSKFSENTPLVKRSTLLICGALLCADMVAEQSRLGILVNDYRNRLMLSAESADGAISDSVKLAYLSHLLDEQRHLVEQTANRHGLDWRLVMGIIIEESKGYPLAESSAGALGAMALMPGTATDLGVRNPLDFAENLEGGTRYLSQLLAVFGDIQLALAAYNFGPNAVRGLMREHGSRFADIESYLPLETRNYVPRVLNYSSASDNYFSLASVVALYLTS